MCTGVWNYRTGTHYQRDIFEKEFPRKKRQNPWKTPGKVFYSCPRHILSKGNTS